MARRSWSGSIVRKARKHVAAMLPAPCWRCGRWLDEGSAWTVGHLIDAAVAPELEHDPSLWMPECARCNYSAGAAAGNRRRAQRPRRVTSRAW